jgi:hypothetical protein
MSAVGNTVTAVELTRVLAHPKFKLSAADPARAA